MPDHSLDDIVHSIQSAVVAATDMAERHELDSIMNQEFWELKVDDEGAPVKDEHGRDVYCPKMVTMEFLCGKTGYLQKRIFLCLYSHLRLVRVYE